MQAIIERSMLVLAILVSSLLVLMPARCSEQDKARAAPAAADSCQTTPAAEATGAADRKSVPAFVANPFCRACHLDFDEEELALDHELFGIGCERCHGESLRHRSDEANVTPPEMMYAKERINPMCMMCHPRQDLQDRKDHQPILEAGLSIFESGPSDPDAKEYCTDCHGVTHRMKTRTIRWDKNTGRPLP
jgi:hypothetical protein